MNLFGRTSSIGRWAVTAQLLIAGALCVGRITGAQHYEHPLPPDFNEPIRLYKVGLGSFSRPISSPNAEAQAYFNQGFQLMYAFAKAEAGRSFREAQKRDPNCAICHWGEAWAWGPYVNGRMTVAHAERAYAAIQKAVSLSDRQANPTEKALIQAMAARYVQRFDPARRLEQDRAYADAMARVAATYPGDLDVATLYAEALFLLLPRPAAFDVKEPTVARVLRALEGALKRDIRHPGACHLYIHTTELTPEPERASACAEYVGDSIPGASHINHMPAHVWVKVGRWGDAVRASLRAWQSNQAALKGEGFATYPAHDLHMMAFAASMDGQSAVAMQAARGFARLTSDSMFHSLILVRFGRFAEVNDLGPRPKHDIAAGMWDFAQGYAGLRQGDLAAARSALDRLHRLIRTSKAVFKIHPIRTLVGTVAAILEGELARATHDAGLALKAFEQAVALQDGFLVDDPEPLPFAARHWLGAFLIDTRRFAEAERVYRQDLARHPRNGWALIGLQQALKGQGKPTAATEKDLGEAWARADVKPTASRF